MCNYKYDIFRYYGKYNISFRERLKKTRELEYIICLRKCQKSSVFTKYINRLKLKSLTKKTMIQIPRQVNIGKGLYIGHIGPIVINPKVVIGNNCNIQEGVVIGQENRGKRKGTPTIGNEVWIGSNSVIVGKITIGNDVLIAPLTFINFDVPNHSIVIGNPAKIIHKEKATEGYINNKI